MKKVISFIIVIAITTSASANVIVEANASVPTKANASVPTEVNASVLTEVNASVPAEVNASVPAEVNASKTNSAPKKGGFGYPSMGGMYSNPFLAVGVLGLIGGIFIVNKLFY
jgi:uncharacterized protein YcnI